MEPAKYGNMMSFVVFLGLGITETFLMGKVERNNQRLLDLWIDR